jgi:predicted outer membrane lipoprotein
MNDFSEIENELKKLRPAQPSPILFDRIEEVIAEPCGASSAADARSGWWRFTEPPYSWGLGLAAAAALVLFAAIAMEHQQTRDKEIAQISPEAQTAPMSNPDQASTSSGKFVPAGATRLVYNTRNEGLQFARGSGQPLRRFRYQTHETWQWRNPTTGASLRVSYPSEEVVLIPVSGQ